ncbi:MAG: DisA protein [Desulfobacteraceae bacterium]|nr:DisA protein [Desulfobacteraceae bacterium]
MDTFINIVSGMRWQDYLDILFISYVMFRLYVLFRGTNVIRVILVICLLWVIRTIALGMGLIITSWAMQGIITVAALVIIIVFRNEISGVLQIKNLKSFLWGIPRYQMHTPVSIIVESAHELSRKKIGALIVLPMKQGLKSCVQGGIDWQGKLSREMLVSIFWHDNPVHDGAAIIQGNRITNVSVILPLSKRRDLPSYFGTRHRAAMGLAEQTDALVLVVSEETGGISLFMKNRVYDINDTHVLETLLDDHLSDDSTRTGIRHHAVELAAAAMISLFSVTGLWLSFSSGEEILANREVPIEFMNLEQKMEIMGSSSNIVKLVISGASPLVQAIGQDQVKVKLDMSNTVPGPNVMGIQRENIQLPPGIRLKQFEPSEVEVTMDETIQKQLAVQPTWTGRLKQGLIISSAKAVPETVMVKGGSMALKEITTLFTEPVPLDHITQSGRVLTSFALDKSNLKLQDHGKNNVTIYYEIKQRSNPGDNIN